MSPPVDLSAARKVPVSFDARLAGRFQHTNSVVFRFHGREMAGLGLVAVDRADESFALVCLTPLGVKLFELKGKGDKLESASALEVFTQKGDFAGAVAADIRHAYFDVIPPPAALVRGKGATMVFRQSAPPGYVEYVFDRAGVLVEKRFRAGRRWAWRIRYGYGEEAGKLVPTAIVLDNRQYGYRLTVKPL